MSRNEINWHAVKTAATLWHLTARANATRYVTLLDADLQADDNPQPASQLDSWSQLRKWQLAERD